MIIDTIKNNHIYHSIHPSFKEAFVFLTSTNLMDFPLGRHDINGDSLFAIIAEPETTQKENAKLEIHKKYIDIQMCIQGKDCIGYRPHKECIYPLSEYNPETDLQFFSDTSASWLTIPEQTFAIFFPHDAHAPIGTNELIRKVVIKINQ